jgi:hypothetical protein
MPANDHDHAGVSAQPRNYDEYWIVPSGRWKYANDADGPTADGSTRVDETLCPQPAAQPDAGVFLTSRGRFSDKLVTSVNSNCCPTPIHNYALAASILLKTINVDAATIKQWAILDSGATSHFLTTNAPATNIVLAAVPLIAHLPNGDKVQSTHTCTCNLPDLLAGARAAHVIPGLASHSLLSVITMYNAGCTVTFTKINCTISYRGHTIICANKCTHTGLWMVPLKKVGVRATGPSATTNHVPLHTSPNAAVATNIDATSSTAKYACYIHQIMCSPLTSTLLRALDLSEELAAIPGLTIPLIKNHLPRSAATNKGHMQEHQANTASMHNMQSDIILACAKVDRMFPPQEICSMQDVFCFTTLAKTITSTMYTDITGAFPVRSFKSMQYVFVAYIYNLNAIIIWAMPSCTNASMVKAFTEVISILKSGSFHPALNVMDNECSAMVEKYIRCEAINIQIVPPHNH